ncbi:MAG: hypothetical protein ABWZ82_01830, partial [Candidatus Limnocylindrales bacterium]
LNDHEIPAILEVAYAAGASSANYTVVRLPFSVKDVFADWLERGTARNGPRRPGHGAPGRRPGR